ncbi:MAG: hypothetical protein ACRDI2_00895 [Chloroflexota bacterium]
MLTNLRYVVLALPVALGTIGCIWAIRANRELLAVGLGSLALVALMGLWLVGLQSAFKAE